MAGKGLGLELGKDEGGQVTGTCVPFTVNTCMYLYVCGCISLGVGERAHTRHSTAVGVCLASITGVCERLLQLYMFYDMLSGNIHGHVWALVWVRPPLCR